jgi:hypothetical protein
MVVNAAFNNISVLSWRSVLLVVETGVTRENYRSAISHSQTYYTVKPASAATSMKQSLALKGYIFLVLS